MATTITFPYTDIKNFTDNVNIEDLDYSVTGDGIFDTLMETGTKHLKAQFEANRIREEDYANAYIELYKYTLQIASDIYLKRGQIEAEIEKTKAETDNTKAETDNTKAETDKTKAETDLIKSEKAKTEAETSLINAQVQLIPLEKDKLQAEVDLANAQAEESRQKVEVLKEQLKLLGKQVETENAKKDLYRRQIEGFDEDYKYKIFKVLMDSWAVGFSVAKDSFEAEGIPAPMQKATINSLYNDYVTKDFDNYQYGRPSLGNK